MKGTCTAAALQFALRLALTATSYDRDSRRTDIFIGLMFLTETATFATGDALMVDALGPAGNASASTQLALGVLLYVPGGVFELALPVLLIARGFRRPAGPSPRGVEDASPCWRPPDARPREKSTGREDYTRYSTWYSRMHEGAG